VALLEGLAAEPRRVAELSDELRRRLMVAAGQLSRPDRYMRKAMRKGLNRKVELARPRPPTSAILDGHRHPRAAQAAGVQPAWARCRRCRPAS
jgi:hypothetical protein